MEIEPRQPAARQMNRASGTAAARWSCQRRFSEGTFVDGELEGEGYVRYARGSTYEAIRRGPSGGCRHVEIQRRRR